MRRILLVSLGALNAQALAFHQAGIARTNGHSRRSNLVALRQSDGGKEPDLIERLFSRVFGRQALDNQAPLGLQRATVEKFPDRFPATKDRLAEPFPGDQNEVKTIIRPLLAQTCLETRALKMVYNAKRDGWRADKFHSKVDKMGPAVVLATLKDGTVCGGYNSKGWVGENELRPGISNFLFTNVVDRKELPIKLRKIGGAGVGVNDRVTTGPFFGADSLCVPLESGSKSAQSKLGSYYEKLPDGRNSLFGDSGLAELADLKVFSGVYARGEPIPFDDVIILSLT